jgi:hypothetical protein
MTPASPTWGDVEEFLSADDWRQLTASERGGRRQPHIFFEKLLDDGRLLQTHISHDRTSGPSPRAFALLLRDQLEVSKHEFWEAVRTGEPVDRPAKLDSVEGAELPAWTIPVLIGQLHMGPAEIAGLTPEEAQRLVHEFWSSSSRP